MSHAPVLVRQTVDCGRNEFDGHKIDIPEQYSGTSQMPVLGRQTVVLGCKMLAGHAKLDPSQNAPASQDPIAARHMTLLPGEHGGAVDGLAVVGMAVLG